MSHFCSTINIFPVYIKKNIIFESMSQIIQPLIYGNNEFWDAFTQQTAALWPQNRVSWWIEYDWDKLNSS